MQFRCVALVLTSAQGNPCGGRLCNIRIGLGARNGGLLVVLKLPITPPWTAMRLPKTIGTPFTVWMPRTANVLGMLQHHFKRPKGAAAKGAQDSHFWSLNTSILHLIPQRCAMVGTWQAVLAPADPEPYRHRAWPQLVDHFAKALCMLVYSFLISHRKPRP